MRRKVSVKLFIADPVDRLRLARSVHEARSHGKDATCECSWRRSPGKNGGGGCAARTSASPRAMSPRASSRRRRRRSRPRHRVRALRRSRSRFESATPVTGAAPTMSYRKDTHMALEDDEHDTVRKSMHFGGPDIRRSHHRKGVRLLRDTNQHGVDRRDEATATTGELALVPATVGLELAGRARRKPESTLEPLAQLLPGNARIFAGPGSLRSSVDLLGVIEGDTPAKSVSRYGIDRHHALSALGRPTRRLSSPGCRAAASSNPSVSGRRPKGVLARRSPFARPSRPPT
jgi:hypothetical protein